MNGKIEAVIFDWVGTLYQFGGIGLFPYSERVLKELHPRYKLAVISKVAPDQFELRRNQIREVEKYFEVIMTSIEKKESEFNRCLRELRIKPENALVVGDRTFREISAGNKVGCKTAWIQTGRHAQELPNEETGEPTYKINSVEDLLTIL